MDAILGIIFLVIFTFPIFGILIWSYLMPEDSILWGRRWMYKEEPEITEEAIRFRKISSLIGIFVIGLILIVSIIRMF